MSTTDSVDPLGELIELRVTIFLAFVERDNAFGMELVEGLDAVPKGVDFPWVYTDPGSVAALLDAIAKVREGLATLSRDELRRRVRQIRECVEGWEGGEARRRQYVWVERWEEGSGEEEG